jgi:hypothetical protein
MPRSLRLWTRVLLAAMLLTTLAPAISRALHASRGMGDWVEICTAHGMRWTPRNGEIVRTDLYAAEAALNALDRCGHCSLTADRFAPLAPSMPVVSTFTEPWPRPRHFEATQRSIEALNPSARGPPNPLS